MFRFLFCHHSWADLMNNIFPRVLVVLSQLKRDDWIPLICPFNSKEDANKLVLPTKCLLLDKVYSDWLDVLTAGIMAATGQLFAASVTSHIHYLHIVATGNDKNNMWAGNLDTENVSFVWLFLEISEWSRYTEMPLHSHFSCKARFQSNREALLNKWNGMWSEFLRCYI